MDRLTSRQDDSGLKREKLWMLETNLDDVSGEILGYCIEKLWKLDVLDVFTTPILMKKNRPANKLSVLCSQEQIATVEQLIFEETTTLGIRRYEVERTALQRKTCTIETSWGPIQGKKATLPNGEIRLTPEFESAKRLAEQNGVSLLEVYNSGTKNSKES
jgi:uncharacterized protein (DUF111 family)